MKNTKPQKPREFSDEQLVALDDLAIRSIQCTHSCDEQAARARAKALAWIERRLTFTIIVTEP